MLALQSRVTALAVACLLLGTQAAAYTMDDMCAQWSGQGYIGNPVDCTGWGYCKAQKLISYGSCASGLVYEPQSQTCQPATTTACTTSGVKTCSALKTAGYVADPSDCTKFAYCFGNGTAELSSCPSGQRFAANNGTCVWGPSCPQDTICRFLPSNIYVGDPNNCGQYLHCMKGYGVWGSCGTGLYYNAALGVCQTNNPCTDTGGDVNLENPDLPPSESTTQCSTADTYMADDLTCYGFYYCKTASAPGQWGACPLGLEFDPKTSKCVSPASIACKFNRCANTNLTYAAVPFTECKEYTYCPNGSKAFCSDPTFPYYDEVSGACVSDIPDYPICKLTA